MGMSTKLPNNANSTLPPMRKDDKRCAHKSLPCPVNTWASNSRTLPTSKATLRPHCWAHGTSQALNCSSKAGICSRNKGHCCVTTGTMSNNTASNTPMNAAMATPAPSHAGTRWRCMRRTHGCSTYAMTTATTNGTSTGPSHCSSHHATRATPAQAKVRICEGVRDMNGGVSKIIRFYRPPCYDNTSPFV